MAATAPVKPPRVPREEDPRNPIFRLTALLDQDSLKLLSPDDDSGMLAATGSINGSPVVAFCSDATVMGGAMGVAGCEVVVQAYRRAMVDRVPIVGIWHSGGARLADGVLSLHAVGRIFHAMTPASGKIPQLSVVLGAAAGGAAYGPALTDVVIIAPTGRIFVTGPDVVRRGARLLHAFGEASVPRVTLVTRKAYGGGYIAMNSRSLGATKVFAWPGAEIAVMGPVAAIRVLHRRKLAEVPEDMLAQVEAELAAEHEKLGGGVERAVEIGVVDQIIEPVATRTALAAAIRDADTGIRGMHTNIAL